MPQSQYFYRLVRYLWKIHAGKPFSWTRFLAQSRPIKYCQFYSFGNLAGQQSNGDDLIRYLCFNQEMSQNVTLEIYRLEKSRNLS